MTDETREAIAIVDEHARNYLAELKRRMYGDPEVWSEDPCDDIDYSELDTGIRDTVRWLRSAGFDTCDSGDGKSKRALIGPEEHDDTYECFISHSPHVIIDVHPRELIDECGRLSRLLCSIGIETKAISPETLDVPFIQGTYLYDAGVAFIELVNVHDGMLPKELRS